MTRVILRGIVARRARTAMTALAIVLGVAMISGALTLSDTLRHAAGSLTASSYRGTDAVVDARTAFTQPAGDEAARPATVPASLLARVRAVPGVATAVGDLTNADTHIISPAGKVVGSGPYFGVGLDARAAGAQRLTPFRLTRGRFATGSTEVVIDAGTAAQQHLHLGDPVRIAAHGPMRTFTVTGIATFGDVRSIGKATFAVFDLGEAQRLFGEAGRFDSILVAATPGVSAHALGANLTAAIGPSARVQSAGAQDRFDLAGLKQFVAIIETVLLAFAGVALFVGAFTIANTLSITVAQRSGELALLRTMGASRRQVRRSVLAEAAATGALASLVGLFAGLGLGKGLSAVLTSAGIDLPQSGTVFALHTIVISLLTGVVVTMLASVSAARRATRVAPVLALDGRPAVTPSACGARASRRGAVLTGSGFAVLVAGLFAGGVPTAARALLLAPAVLLLFVGIASLMPVAVPVLARLLGAITARTGGVAGRLARGNAVRNPRRTAASASPLMIGVTLVVLLAIVAGGLQAGSRGSIRQSIRAGYVVASSDGYSPMPPSAAAAVAMPGATVSPIAQSEVEALGQRATIDGVDPATISGAYRFGYQAGSAAAPTSLAGSGAMIDDRFASRHHLRLGGRFVATTAAGRPLTLVVTAIVRPVAPGGLGLGTITIARERLARVVPGALDRLAFVTLHPGQGGEQTLARRLARYPDVKAWTAAGFAAQQVRWLGSVLAVFYVLLALAVIISLVGIVNTLALSTLERTRELGTLRALGMSRRQVRRMVRHESVITSLLGAAMGIGLGLGLAALVTLALHHDGLRFAVPVGSLIAFLVIALLAGVAAAVAPARRASRMQPLIALAYE